MMRIKFPKKYKIADYAVCFTKCLRHSLFLFFLAVLSIMHFTYCSSGGNGISRSIMPCGISLREGDVVLRCGSGMTSRAVLAADRGGIYSHVGIVVDSAGVKMIVHAVPGEPDFEGDDDRVKMDSVGRFFSSLNAEHGEVLRHKNHVIASAAARNAVEIYRRRTLFDNDYDEDDTTRMCCTELINFSFAKTGNPLTGIQRHKFRILNISTNCAFPSDILNCDDFRSVAKF